MMLFGYIFQEQDCSALFFYQHNIGSIFCPHNSRSGNPISRAAQFHAWTSQYWLVSGNGLDFWLNYKEWNSNRKVTNKSKGKSSQIMQHLLRTLKREGFTVDWIKSSVIVGVHGQPEYRQLQILPQ